MTKRKRIKIRFTEEYFTSGSSSWGQNQEDHSTVWLAYAPNETNINYRTQEALDMKSITWWAEARYVVPVVKPTVLISMK